MELLAPFIQPFIGGMLIGTAAMVLMVSSGRIAGISGIAYNAITAPLSSTWAVLFLLGLLVGTTAFHFLSGTPIPANDASLAHLIVGGLLVGIGTKLGSGCTSGHGICGLARISPRSMVAVATFMLAGFVTVFIRLHGGLS